ncbi:unnamed protein product [Symbiodinium sp. CCMP2592]|nr:unnamed protein product [Symbiodinium sp. CCMP2592]
MLLLALFLSVAGVGHASVCRTQEETPGAFGIVADEDVGSLLQRGNLLRVNISSLEHQVKPEKRLLKRAVPKHCGPAGITSAVLGYYVLILLSSLWAALSGTDGGLSESESHGRGSCSQLCQVLQGCAWQLLLGLATGYVGKENPQAASLLTCLVSGAALGACQVPGTKEGGEPKLALSVRGFTFPHALWICFVQFASVFILQSRGSAGLELAWMLSLLAMLLSAYIAYVQLFLRTQTGMCNWILTACSTSLLVTLTLAYVQLLGEGEPSCFEDWEAFLALRFNRACAFGGAAFICIMYVFHEVAPGSAIQRVAFLGIFICLLTPGLSAIGGRDLLYGPWGMFGGDKDDTKLTPFGYIVLALALPVALWMCIRGAWPGSKLPGPEVVGMGWDHRGPSATLALVRILLAYWLVVNPNWGGATPIMMWYAPDQWPGGAVMTLLLVLAQACLALGIFSSAAAALAAAGFCLGCTRDGFDPDCPTQHAAMVLLILAFTPCDDCFSLKSVAERFLPGWCTRGRGGGSLWALSLLRLQMSLLYFWAGEFKAKISWVQGSTLYRDVAILDTSPLKSLWYLIFWTEPIRRSVTTVLACSALALELTLPFLLWSKSFHIYAVALAASMHFGMTLLAGQLGGFSQVCWITLLGSLQDKRVEDLLQDPRNFAIGVLGGIALMACIGDAFEIHGEPYGTLDPAGLNKEADKVMIDEGM